MAASGSPWRNPVLWLVVLLPLASIVGGVALVVTASRNSGSDDAVGDTVRRTGQIQTAELGADATAGALKLSALLRSADGAIEVYPVTGEFERGRPLEVVFEHPSHQEMDRTLTLAPTALGWAAEAEIDPGQHWNIRLAPADARWRLRGRLGRDGHAAHLRPILAQD
ncbi:FixH family protein [Coralloluteibacterium stylophorae]|uniref:FixH family protein n=1 Tax=Coralloluteibacterium stylophorae TaxID=1776034 RepID=A0A8J8AZX5_9GAMM|nr:FixH family protein [Coralloluteibacterium stylophorae]MBS7457424.1 FixH family protein [Coralloluteibacterium stylophorae]